MKEVNCEVIRDLLPLYVDDIASPKTREMVQEHLNTCPECREELRQMRSLVFLPPDEDTELVLQKLRDRSTRQRRKKKITIISTLSAVALIILCCAIFCLWYTRPQSWPALTGITEQPDALSGDYFTYSGELQDFVSWDLAEVDGGDAIARKILNELSAVPYRASLRNITDRIPSPVTTYRNLGIGRVSLFIRSQDLQSGASIDLFVNGEVHLYTFAPSKISDRTIYETDGELYDTLAALIQEYGEFKKI